MLGSRITPGALNQMGRFTHHWKGLDERMSEMPRHVSDKQVTDDLWLDAQFKSCQGRHVGFQPNHLVPTPLASTSEMRESWGLFLGRSHGKGCCRHVEHAWGQHVGGNSMHHKALGLGLWMPAKYMQA